MSEFPRVCHYYCNSPAQTLLRRPAYAISSSHTSAVDINSCVMFTDAGGFVVSGQIKNGDAASRPPRCSSEWVNP